VKYIHIYRANQRTIAQHKKTIQPADVLEALKQRGFGAFVERAEAELDSEFCSLFPSSVVFLFLGREGGD
jgi:hypothetical protein